MSNREIAKQLCKEFIIRKKGNKWNGIFRKCKFGKDTK